MPSNSISAADLTQKLEGLGFPANKQDLIEQARDNNAGEQGGKTDEMARRGGKHSHDGDDRGRS